MSPVFPSLLPVNDARPIDAALTYAANGWPVFPLAPGQKIPAIPGGRGVLDATTDPGQIARWWAAYPAAGIGLACGPASGLWVLDIDAGTAGEALLDELAGRLGLPSTLTAQTGGGGRHLVWRYPEGREIRNRVAVRHDGARVHGLDVRSAGGYIAVAPTRHPSGGVYAWQIGGAVAPAEAPAWLLDLVAPVEAPRPAPRPYEAPPSQVEADRERQYCARALARACERIAAARDGRRALIVTEAYTAGGWVGAGLLDEARARGELEAAGVASGTRHDVARAVGAGLAAGILEPRRPTLTDDGWTPPPPKARGPDLTAPPAWLDDGPAWDDAPPPRQPAQAPATSSTPPERGEPETLTDTGNARRMARRRGADLRYCGALPGDGWLVWDGGRWRLDEGRQARRWAAEVAVELAEEAARVEQEAEDAKGGEAEILGRRAAALRKAATSAECDRGIRATLECLRDQPGIQVAATALDADPWLLGVQNGVIDLRTGVLREARREDLILQVAGAAYDPAAKAPTWERFVSEIMGGDAALVEYLRRCVGYSLAGVRPEQMLLILHGNGANGKGTFIRALQGVFGGYGKTAAADTFLAKRDSGISNGLAALAGARFCAASETNEGKKLDEALVKSITGEDEISVRFLNREFFSYTPRFQVWLSTNHRPRITGTDRGIWRRLKLVPFDQSFEERPDAGLGARLDAERAGILAWAVRGCLDWQAGGLQTPERVRAAVEEYRADMDQLSGFLAERCEEAAGAEASNAALYASFREWARDQGEEPWSHSRLSRELKARGLRQGGSRKGGRSWVGLRLVVTASAGMPGGDRWGD